MSYYVLFIIDNLGFKRDSSLFNLFDPSLCRNSIIPQIVKYVTLLLHYLLLVTKYQMCESFFSASLSHIFIFTHRKVADKTFKMSDFAKIQYFPAMSKIIL